MPPESEVRSSIQSTTLTPASATGCDSPTAPSPLPLPLPLPSPDRLGFGFRDLGSGGAGSLGMVLQFFGSTEVEKRAGYRYWPMPSSGCPGSRAEKRRSSELTE